MRQSEAKRDSKKSVSPVSSVVIDGTRYDMRFDFAALAQAEEQFRQEGRDVNLLVALPELTLSSVRVIFPCAIRSSHPKLTYEKAQALVRIDTVFSIVEKIAEAWKLASPEASAPQNPSHAEGGGAKP